MVINMTSEEKKRRKRKNLLIALGVILAIVIIIAASIAWIWPKSKDIRKYGFSGAGSRAADTVYCFFIGRG